MHAHGRLGEPEQRRELADGARGRRQRMEQRETGGISDGLEPPRHRLGPSPCHGIAVADTGPDHDEVGELEVHAGPEEEAGDEEERLPRLDARDDLGQVLTQDVTPRSDEDLERATTVVLRDDVAPRLLDDRQRLLPHVVHGPPDLLEEIEVRAHQLGGLLELPEAVDEGLALRRALGRHVQAEGNRGDGRLDRLPQRVGRGLAESPGVVGEDLHLGEADLVGLAAPEVADAIRQVLTAAEHLGQLGVPGLHRRSCRHRHEPRQVAGQRGTGGDRSPARRHRFVREHRHPSILDYS